MIPSTLKNTIRRMYGSLRHSQIVCLAYSQGLVLKQNVTTRPAMPGITIPRCSNLPGSECNRYTPKLLGTINTDCALKENTDTAHPALARSRIAWHSSATRSTLHRKHTKT